MPASYEDLADTIDRVARRVAADYPDISWEDVRQELSLFVIVNGESIKLRDDGGNPTWLLNRVAQTYCMRQRTQHMSLSPQYAYRPSEVKKILETAFSVEDVMDTYVPDDAKSMKGLDEVEIASDVKAAYDRLNQEEKVSIFRRYALGEIPNNASYERKKLNAAIKKLTHRLNTYRGRGPEEVRMRRAISNAGARAAISEVYDGQG
jgi:hypothetical protein